MKNNNEITTIVSHYNTLLDDRKSINSAIKTLHDDSLKSIVLAYINEFNAIKSVNQTLKYNAIKGMAQTNLIGKIKSPLLSEVIKISNAGISADKLELLSNDSLIKLGKLNNSSIKKLDFNNLEKSIVDTLITQNKNKAIEKAKSLLKSL